MSLIIFGKGIIKFNCWNCRHTKQTEIISPERLCIASDRKSPFIKKDGVDWKVCDWQGMGQISKNDKFCIVV